MKSLTCQFGMGTGTGQFRYATQALRVAAPFYGSPFGKRPCGRRPSLRHRPPAPYRDVLDRSGGGHAYPY